MAGLAVPMIFQVWEPCSERQLLRLPRSSSLVVTVPAMESLKDHTFSQCFGHSSSSISSDLGVWKVWFETHVSFACERWPDYDEASESELILCKFPSLHVLLILIVRLHIWSFLAFDCSRSKSSGVAGWHLFGCPWTAGASERSWATCENWARLLLVFFWKTQGMSPYRMVKNGHSTTNLSKLTRTS